MRKCLFLDRDGVINKDTGYVHKIENFIFEENIFEICRFFQKQSFHIIVITNQAGIAKGFYDIKAYYKLTKWMLEKFIDEGISLSRVYYDPTHPQGIIDKYRKISFFRKPNPGMILKAQTDYNLDLNQSFLIGDRDSDIQAGVSAGIKYNFRLKSKYPVKIKFNQVNAKDNSNGLPQIYRVNNLHEIIVHYNKLIGNVQKLL